MRSILDKILGAIMSLIRTALDNQSRTDAAFALQSERVEAVEVKVDQILNLLLLPPADHFRFAVTVEGNTTTGAISMTLTDSQKGLLSIEVLDGKQQPAALDGVPVWASSDETIATVEADDSGLNAVVTAVRPGSCSVTVTGDADLGAGVTPIVGTLSVSVTAGQAVQIKIDEGPISDQ